MKIAQTMREIDLIGAAMIANFTRIPVFVKIDGPINDFVNAAKIKAENLRTDPDIFDVWAQLVTAAERLANFTPQRQVLRSEVPEHNISDGLQLVRSGRDLIFYIARARTPMPKSTREYIERCEIYLASGQAPLMPAPLPA